MMLRARAVQPLRCESDTLGPLFSKSVSQIFPDFPVGFSCFFVQIACFPKATYYAVGYAVS